MFLDGKGLMTYFFNQEPGTMAASSNITGFSFQYIGKRRYAIRSGFDIIILTARNQLDQNDQTVLDDAATRT